MQKTLTIFGRSPVRANLLTTIMLLAWCVAPVAANGIERETPMPIDTDVRIVNSGSTNTLGFTLTAAMARTR